jgi:tetratricopeptide (TPR) repeat protein
MRRYSLLILIVSLGPIIGCNRTRAPDVAASPSPTFHRDIAPILFARCAGCHHPEGAAPFSLLTYEDARERAGQIAEVTQSRFMPPWLPEDGHEPLAHNRRLSDSQVKLLADWAAHEAPEGDPNQSPNVPIFHSGWHLGKPDLVLESAAFKLPAKGPDRFRNFVLDVPPHVNRWVRAVEVRPSNPKVTHHARLGIDVNNESVRRDAADADIGYEGMAWGADPEGQLIIWTPGMTTDAGTPGAAWQLPAKAKLVLHTHLQPSGKPETIGFRIGFYFTDSPPTLRPYMLLIGSRDVDIPPSEPRHEIVGSYKLPIDVDAHYIFPHAHSLCREMVVEARLPGGERKTLLAIRRFDENWHDTYRFAKAVRLPQGTELITRFTYDNTAANVRNPNHPPARVAYGSNADDEMSDVYLQVTPVDPAQRAVLAEHHQLEELKSKIVGYGKSLELHPDDLWSIEALASCYVAAGSPGEAVKLLELYPDLLQTSPQANVVLGMAQLALRNADAAEKSFRDAIAKDEQLAVAWLGLGQAQVAKSKPEEAEQALRRAIELAPKLVVARLDLADLLVEQDRLDEAGTVCAKAMAASPGDHRPHLKIANIQAQQHEYVGSLIYFEEARKLAPFLYSPQSSLAIACYQLGDEPTARELLQESLANEPDDPVPHCFLGQIARRDGQWDKARNHLQRAAELPTPRSWPASHRRQFLALVYNEQIQLAEQLQDKVLARNTVANWLRIDPENQSLQALKRQLD